MFIVIITTIIDVNEIIFDMGVLVADRLDIESNFSRLRRDDSITESTSLPTRIHFESLSQHSSPAH
jgi:hypothetical protein